MCLFVYSTSLSVILSIKNRLNNLKGSCVSMLEGRLGKPWSSELLIWRGLNLGNGPGLRAGGFRDSICRNVILSCLNNICINFSTIGRHGGGVIND